MNVRLAGIITVALAVLWPAIASAQVPELTQRFQGDGWSVGYPADWLVLVDAPLLLGNAEEMRATVQEGRDPPDGGIAVGFFPASVLEQLGLPPAGSAMDVLLAVADQFNGVEGDPQELADWPLPAFGVALRSPVPGETWAIGAKTSAGLVGLVVNAADVEAILPLVQAIVASYAAE